MTGSDIGTWIGTAFSIIGAGIAVWQTRQAISAAARAKQMRDEIAARNAHGELSGLYGILAAAIRKMDKYGPGARPTFRRGFTPDNDASAVRDLTTQMALHKAMLAKTFGNAIDGVQVRLTGLLAEFGAANSEEGWVGKGCEIHIELTELSGNIKQAMDGNIYGKK